MSQSFSSCQLHFLNNKVSVLTFTFIWANSADDNLLIFSLSFFSRKLALTFHANQRDSLHEIPKPFSSEKKKCEKCFKLSFGNKEHKITKIGYSV